MTHSPDTHYADVSETSPKQDESPSFEECYFYHCWNLPDGSLIRGHFDLRGREDRYTGFIDLKGKTVMEIGPASGGLTLYMEKQGAEVLCFETSSEVSIDVLPKDGEDLPANIQAGKNVTSAVIKSWNYMRRQWNLKAKMIFGDVNKDPSKFGPVDITVLGAILLHCKSPFSVLHQACLASKEAVVVTDLLPLDVSPDENCIRFNPTNGIDLVMWWSISPGAIRNMLTLHGFKDCTTITHDVVYYKNADPSNGPSYTKMYTVVGRR